MALNLEDIGVNVDNLLYRISSFTQCCQTIDTGTIQASGSWMFPGGFFVPSRSGRTASIVRTQGPSSVILHRLSIASSPTGVCYCEIPDGAGIRTRVFAHFFFKTIPGTITNVGIIPKKFCINVVFSENEHAFVIDNIVTTNVSYIKSVLYRLIITEQIFNVFMILGEIILEVVTFFVLLILFNIIFEKSIT